MVYAELYRRATIGRIMHGFFSLGFFLLRIVAGWRWVAASADHQWVICLSGRWVMHPPLLCFASAFLCFIDQVLEILYFILILHLLCFEVFCLFRMTVLLFTPG